MFSKSRPRAAPRKTKSFCNPHGLEDSLGYRCLGEDSNTLLSGHDPLRRIPVAAPVPPQLVLMVQGRSETLVVWGAKPRRGQERLRKGQESPRNGQESPGEPRRGPGGAGPATRGVKSSLRSTSWEPKHVPERCFGHPRCQIFVEVDILEPKRCTRTVFWAPEVSDPR